MKKIKMSTINIVEHLNEESINSIKELFRRTLRLTIDTMQYVLISKYSSSDMLHNGIIAFSKASYSESMIGFFSLHVTKEKIVTSSTNNMYKFFDVTYRGERHIAIVKPSPYYDQCIIESFSTNGALSEYQSVNQSELTNIVAL